MFIIAVLWTAFFIINFNIAMMIPLLPFMQRDIGLSSSGAGLVLAVFPVVALISNLALGPFIDRFGGKRFIVAGAAMCAAILLLTAAGGSAVPHRPRPGGHRAVHADDRRFRLCRHRRLYSPAGSRPHCRLCHLGSTHCLPGLHFHGVLLAAAVLAAAVAHAGANLSGLGGRGLDFASHEPRCPVEHPDLRAKLSQRLLSLSLDAAPGSCCSPISAGRWGCSSSWALSELLVQHGLRAKVRARSESCSYSANRGAARCPPVRPARPIVSASPDALRGRIAGHRDDRAHHPLRRVASGFSALAYAIFAFGRDLMLALILAAPCFSFRLAKR